MSWQPITEEELQALLGVQLAECSADQQRAFSRICVSPYQVPIHRLGQIEKVFVVAELPSGLLYFEDVEEGFELGRLGADGVLPDAGCNQYELKHILARAGL